jgi:hypothetical protein
MPVAIDASTPPSLTSTSSPIGCAAFTPPSDALLLAMWADNTGVGVDPNAAACSSSPAQTWTRYAWDHLSSGSPSLDGQAALWAAQLVGAPGSSTVSVARGSLGLDEQALATYVLTGHDSVAPIGAVGGDRQSGVTSLDASYVASIDGGQGFMIVCDWGATSTADPDWQPGTGCDMVAKGTISGQISYAVVRRTNPDGVLGATTHLGITSIPASPACALHYVYVEIISIEAAAAAAAAGYPSFGAIPPMF